ncbi:hypothetical protein CGZ94_20660 [Enemella evansiae]|uniref:Uncharacterized protein n=1 Tax=Enemella evansiae TaxID=2016499 RepID=A0A255G133_9ACTN|nr:hypothetical protein [Enemella evansiae]OYO07883.1 hypothetical protein CGZ94_20660 [Enemella evansiae]
MSITALDIADAVALRCLADSLHQATGIWWERRAESFDWAASRPGDFTGRATAEEIAFRDARCRDAARLCREHARLLQEVAA